VLNSLSLDFISSSLALVAEDGAFCEIGKRGVWSSMRLGAAVGAAFACSTIALDADLADEQWAQYVLTLISRRVASDVAHGLPLQEFDLARCFESAFRTLLNGLSTGKVVLHVRRKALSIRASDRSQLLMGGTGGLGLLTGRWLAQHGTRSMLLASRTGTLPVGVSIAPGAECVQLRVSTATVLTERCDAADAFEVCRLVSSTLIRLSAAVDGVWHAAGVLSDGMLSQQGAASCSGAPMAQRPPGQGQSTVRASH